ncbi:MAG TPA: TlpA disulfide reductase family protein [Candidatus Polarisedimenticolaceae bacterium]|nr:TlpA disulfide reductase family protein [Candidatus Polarisedimenticolaceae bacterium]
MTGSWRGTVGICLLLATACSRGAPSSSQEPAPTVATPQVAPDFTLQNLEGAQVRLSDSAGRVRLIDFWATWCAPCREEIPMLRELYQAYGDQGLTILAISDEDREVLRAFVQAQGIPYPNLIGNDELGEQYGVLGLPMAFLVDREGKIVESFLGPKPRKPLETRIRELLGLPPAA